MSAVLSLDGVSAHYGTSHVLFDVSLRVGQGEIVCLLGRNGAGKTTTIKSIVGLVHVSSGRVLFGSHELQRRQTDQIARLGVGYVADARIIFPDLTVRENLEVGVKKGPSPVGFEWTVERIYDLFPPLQRLDKNLGAYLSGGEQQMLAVGRTLMGNPSLLLLDEPVEGVAPIIVRDLGNQLRKLKELGLTILFSEQNVPFATAIADRGYVIEKGRIRFEGTMDELSSNEEVKRKYLML
ncbi:MAG TPA: ABC transporter ATP-binding protein [Afipia sp.]|nr:ABC transporter ATP-binding protein [Afipia sp.]OUX62623.1 MAG: ABC transporter ATP-binding protein [Afipia sp. TMED4]HAO40023.1 ABC transporter ATP-binding protein [Afipia sp.]HAQ93562.1 ABC transporter ATP-binding protein [Afipia sp.]HBF55861.1 ABC transporter ATP-binding protein [Afipia sp.]|tara:strand:- start:916 stop:1629 length:714 start_codon:yes stop_codon:yes gene_type:complete